MAQKKIIQVELTTGNDLVLEMAERFSKILDEKFLKLQPPVNEDPFITRQDVAEIFRITVQTVHAWMHAGILKPYKIGNKTRFLLSEVKAAAIKTGSKKGLAND